MRRIVKLILLGAIGLCFVWIWQSKEIEPIVTALTLIVALIGEEFWPAGNKHERDKKLFEKFLSDFPSRGRTIEFLRNQSIGEPFPRTNLDDLDSFLSKWDNAEHEFKLKKVDFGRVKLLKKARELRGDMSVRLFQHRNPSLLTMDLPDHSIPAWQLEILNNLDQLADEVFTAHQEFIKLGNKYLY